MAANSSVSILSTVKMLVASYIIVRKLSLLLRGESLDRPPQAAIVSQSNLEKFDGSSGIQFWPRVSKKEYYVLRI